MKRFHIRGLKALVAGGMLAGALGLGMSATGSSDANNTSPSTSPTDKTMNSENRSSGNATGELPPNVSPGWKIRVCSEKTKADKIQFKFSTADKKGGMEKSTKGEQPSSTGSSSTGSSSTEKSDQSQASSGGTSSSEDLTAWTRGDSSMVSVPSDLREVQKLRIEAMPSEKKAKSSICVLYNDHVTKKLNFSDREVSTVKADDNGECGC
jgi:hypothetical protein